MASDLGLHCSPRSHKKIARLIWLMSSVHLFFSRLFRGRNSCCCNSVELVKLLPVHRHSVDIFHILVLQEYWILRESRIPLKPVLGAWELLHFPLVL